MIAPVRTSAVEIASIVPEMGDIGCGEGPPRSVEFDHEQPVVVDGDGDTDHRTVG